MKSPFSEGRFEHEAKHLYYLPDSCFSKLEQPRPTYLIGSRGSGKTTLMKALHWKERLDNTTLLHQLGEKPFRGAFIGNYVKLPNIQLESFNSWLIGESENNYGLLFGLYLDLTCLELLSHSIGELLARQSLKISASHECKAVECWLEDYPKLQHFHDQNSPQSVSQFRKRIQQVRRALEQYSFQRISLEASFDEFAPEQIGSLACSVAKKMAALCEMDTASREQPWHFKVCMDEGETLNPVQQRIVNTIVRLSEWPLFHVVSYVSSPDDMTTTLAPHLTLQKADRQVIVLDDFKQPEFQEFAEGVATVRCREALQNLAVVFSTQQVLGKLSINRLLKTVLDRSENPKAKRLLDEAKKLSHGTSAGAELPIYEVYLAEKLKLPGSPESQKEQRLQRSKQYRKKMVAAYLSICRDFKVRHVLYASAEMVLSISDNCVRDYLSQLDQLFVKSGLELQAFLDGGLDWDTQAQAIRAASIEKRDSIPQSGILSPVETGRIVRGLARITANIQSWSEDNRHLRSSERGLFKFSSKASQCDELTHALAIVQDAADAGFLRVKKEGGRVKLFRVNASLAPSYGFSYRGAYYEATIDLSDFNSLKTADTEGELERVSDAIADKLSRQPPEPLRPLFEGTVE